MANPRRGRVGRLRFCRTLCFCCATWTHIAATLGQAGSDAQLPALTGTTAEEEMIAASGIAIIPSAPIGTSLIPSVSTTSSRRISLIPSAPRSSSTSALPPLPTVDEPSLAAPPNSVSAEATSSSSSTPISLPAHTALIPSIPIFPIPQPTTLDTVSSPPTVVPTQINGTIPISITNVVPSLPTSPTGMTSTQEGLHPIPAPTTSPGDPDGHHEIPEPNFTSTLACRACSAVVEIPATGWETVNLPSFPVNVPPAQEQETKASSPAVVTPVVTLSASRSNVLVKPDPSSNGDFIIGDDITVKPGQTVIVGGNTPIAVHTSNGRTDVVVGGTQTVPLRPPYSPPMATVTAGSSPVVVKPAPSGGSFIIGDWTVSPGQTVTVSNTPIVVQVDASHTNAVIGGTQTVPLIPADSQITEAPVFLPVALGNGVKATPLSRLNYEPNAVIPAGYVIDSQTLLPGGPAITISGVAYSLLPSATQLVVNGQTTTLHPSYGTLFTTVSPGPLTLWDHVYTANRAGYYTLAPGITLVPGGPPVTVSGSVISLEPQGTAAIIQGSTSAMQPVTEVVTLTRSPGADGAIGTAAEAPLPTVGKGSRVCPGKLEGLVLLGAILMGRLGAWL